MILMNDVVSLYFVITYGLIFFQAPSPSEMLPMPIQSSLDECSSNSGDGTPGKGNNSRWSTLSWDIPVDLLSPPTPDPSSTFHLDSDSRPSSGTLTWIGHKPWKRGVKLNINYTPFSNLCCCFLHSFFHLFPDLWLPNFHSCLLLLSPLSPNSHVLVPDKPVQMQQIRKLPCSNMLKTAHKIHLFYLKLENIYVLLSATRHNHE